MQFHETHFDHYLNAHAENSLHPALALTYKKFPPKITNLKNLIFYGPNSVGQRGGFTNQIAYFPLCILMQYTYRYALIQSTLRNLFKLYIQDLV